MKFLGAVQSEKVLSSAALSPYISGECLYATRDGCVNLWNVRSKQQTLTVGLSFCCRSFIKVLVSST